MTAMERGMQYEKQIRVTLERKGHQAKLWADVPEEWLEAAGMIHDYNRHRALRKRAWREGNPLRDTGVDLVVKKQDSYELIQCKNYTGMLCQGDLAGFFRHCAYFPHLKGLVYHSNPSLSYTLELPPNYNRIRYVHEPYVAEVVSEGSIMTVPEVVLRDYQREAVTAALRLLTGSVGENGIGPRTVLNLSCGTGKTMCAATVAKAFNRVVVFSPTRVLSEQNLGVFSGALNRFSVLVDTDGCRDVRLLKGDLAVENKWLVSATFKSADVVQAILEGFEDLSRTLVVIDEVHGLSRAQVTDEANPMNKILMSNVAILSMSATPRIFDLEGETVDYEGLFGPMCYQMKMEAAIERGLITDYRVYIPLVHEVGDEDEIMRECGLDVVKKDTTAKCTFLLKGMLMKGARRCIVYLDTHDAIEEFYEVLERVAREYYGLGDGFWVSALTSEDGQNVRKKTLEKFAHFQGLSVILSVNLLNEGMDIPSCDSVFFASPCKSKIRIVQRVCRANRVDNLNSGKVANVFVWAEETNECVNLVGALKEFDCHFCKKVCVVSRKYERINNERNLVLQGRQVEFTQYCLSVRKYNKHSSVQPAAVRAKAVVEFANTHFRLPTQSDSGNNKSLHNFLSDLKRKLQISALTPAQALAKDYLDKELPTWFDGLETKYIFYAKHVVQFFEDKHYLPSTKSPEKGERLLGKWFAQYRRLENGTASGPTYQTVTALFDRSLPYWKDGFEFNAYQQALKLLVWVKANDMLLPIRKSSSNSLSLFLKACRSDKIGNKYESITNFLDKELPLWNKPHEYDALWKAKRMVEYKLAHMYASLCKNDKFGHTFRRMRLLYRENKYPYSSVIAYMNDKLPNWAD